MPPIVYLYHGEDELSITQALHTLEGKVGDSSNAAMDAIRLDGRALNLEELRGAVSAIPFFAKRRLVIVSNPLAKVDSNPALREKLVLLLEKVPETTALVLVEYRSLSGDGKKKPDHWLLKWAQEAGPRALARHYPALKGGDMEKFIQRQAEAVGGRFSIQGARALAPLVGEDTRLAYQEINKLLAYVDYGRPVEAEDVAAAAAATGQADIFAMVDALGNQDGKRAMSMLQRLLEEQDFLNLFGMIVRQFRLLLLGREIVESGGGKEEIARTLKIHPFVAEKVQDQARRFSLPALEAIYKRLLDVDESIKTGQMEGDVALEAFVAELCTSPV